MKKVLGAGIVLGTVLLITRDVALINWMKTVNEGTTAIVDWIKTNSEQIKFNNGVNVALGETIARLEKRVDELESRLAELSKKGEEK